MAQPRIPKKVLVALPSRMLEQIDYIARFEHRSRSDLLREGMRRYIDAFKNKNAGLSEVFCAFPPEVL